MSSSTTRTWASEDARIFERVIEDGFLDGREHQPNVRRIRSLCKTCATGC